MIPRNFPARVNARRIGALMNLPNTPENAEIRGLLMARIVPEDVARARRTKINRSATNYSAFKR